MRWFIFLPLAVLVVLFIVCSLFLIAVGGARRWQWVRNPWFRLGHLLAIGWVRMTVPLAGGRAGSVVAACLFLAWSAFTHTNFAGEWVIGGVEGKGFAYAFLWMGI